MADNEEMVDGLDGPVGVDDTDPDTTTDNDDVDDSGDGEGGERAGAGGGARRFDPADLPQSIRNRLRSGVLVAHHVSRDIVIPADGDAALRLIAVFAGLASRSSLDLLDPAYSSAENGWTSLDLSALVGVTWIPGGAPRQERVVIDPLLS